VGRERQSSRHLAAAGRLVEGGRGRMDVRRSCDMLVVPFLCCTFMRFLLTQLCNRSRFLAKGGSSHQHGAVGGARSVAGKPGHSRIIPDYPGHPFDDGRAPWAPPPRLDAWQAPPGC
jgi:hypothetical protein